MEFMYYTAPYRSDAAVATNVMGVAAEMSCQTDGMEFRQFQLTNSSKYKSQSTER
jgi:hypothetical protein